jgi:hypothetical protein
MSDRIDSLRELLKPWETGGALGPGRFTSASGIVVDFFKPAESEVPDLPDLALALGNQCRWGGHMRAHYSVAQHSVWVSRVCWLLADEFVAREVTSAEREAAALAGLVHDIEEGVAQDLIRPVKYHMGPEYVRLAREWREVIQRKLGIFEIVQPWKELVKLADDLALIVEDAELRNGHVAKRLGSVVPSWVPVITVRQPQQTAVEWLQRYQKLTETRV